MKMIITSLMGLMIMLASLQASEVANSKSGKYIKNNRICFTNQQSNFINKTTLLEEGFEGAELPPTGWVLKDADGDGNNWLYMPTYAIHSGTKAITSKSYLNGNGPLTPNNYLITPQITLPEGSAANINYWVCSQDESFPKEHYEIAISTTGINPADFTSVLYKETLGAKKDGVGAWQERNVLIPAIYAGMKVYIAFRHCNSSNNYAINLDDIKISSGEYTDTDFPVTSIPTGTFVAPGKVMNITTTVFDASGIASIVGHYKLDGQTGWTDFAMTPTKIYSKYTGIIPAQSATINGMVKFTSTDVVAPTANCGDSPESEIRWAQEITYDFESGIPVGWSNLDADGDGNVWAYESSYEAHSGIKSVSSASYFNEQKRGALTPDNLLITQKLKVGADAKVKFWVCAQDELYPAEHYGLGISTAGTAANNFIMLFEETLTVKKGPGSWYEKTVDIPSSYVGRYVYLAFRHFSCTDMFYINLDDVSLINLESIVNIDDESTPVDASLSQNYPNPFNPTTSINFTNNQSGIVKLTVLNAQGETVAVLLNDKLSTGNHKVNFNGASFNSGVYFYKLETPSSTVTKKMILVK